MPVPQPESTPSGASAVRASNAERDEVVAVLRNAAAEGRITPEEADARIESVGAAQFREDLSTATADLPSDAEHSKTGPGGSSVRDAGRTVSTAVLGLILAVMASAHRHRLITAALVVLGIVACVSLVVLLDGGLGGGRQGVGRHPNQR